MSRYGARTMSCTVCSSAFRMVSGDLVHPADVLCGTCVLSIWDGAARESWAPGIRPRMGIGADILAVAIETRIRQLREMVTTREEVEAMLTHRAG